MGADVTGSTSVIILCHAAQFCQVSRFLGMNIHKPRELGLLSTLLDPKHYFPGQDQGWRGAVQHLSEKPFTDPLGHARQHSHVDGWWSPRFCPHIGSSRKCPIAEDRTPLCSLQNKVPDRSQHPVYFLTLHLLPHRDSLSLSSYHSIKVEPGMRLSEL